MLSAKSLPAMTRLSSRPEEFHLRALPEPCMTLSNSHGSRCSAAAMT